MYYMKHQMDAKHFSEDHQKGENDHEKPKEEANHSLEYRAGSRFYKRRKDYGIQQRPNFS